MKYGWLHSRKSLIFWIFYEIFIYFFLLYLINKDYSFNFYSSYLFFLNAWILLSYVFGRYVIPSRVSDIKHSIKANLYSSFITAFSCLIINLVINFFLKDDGVIGEYYFLNLFFLVTYLSQVIINNIFLKNIKKRIKWFYFGSNEILNFLIEEKDLTNEKIYFEEINEINFENIKIKSESDLAGIIIDDKDFIDKSQQSEIFKIQSYGIKVLTPLQWCEKYLQNIPSKLICTLSVLPPNSSYKIHEDKLEKVLYGVVF